MASKTSAPPPAGGNLISRTVRRLLGHAPPKPSGPPPSPSGTITLPAGGADTVSIVGADGQPVAVSLAEMRVRLLMTINLTEADYRELAALRADRIQRYLLATGKMESSRLFLANATAPAATPAPNPRVVFVLR